MNPNQQELDKLQQQLSEVAIAQDFFKTQAGELFQRLVNAKVTKIVRDISSDKYMDDHDGYVRAVIEMKVYKDLLKSMQVAGAPARIGKITERIERLENAESQ